MIVVDANVVIYSYIENELKGLAHQVRQIDPDWRIPNLWRHEFLNFLSTIIRYKGCDLKTAEGIWLRAVEDLSRCEREGDMLLALSIACEHKITAYDAQYIAVSKSLGVVCVTEDRQLLKKFPGWAVSMKDFCASVG